jgi:tetratricopeptide (TPR) repeat protein
MAVTSTVSAELPEVFVSYSHKDEPWKDRLLPQLGALEKAGKIALWEDRRIKAGDEWNEDIREAITRAAFAVCLISPNYLNSDFCLKDEIAFFLKRREEDGLVVIPILVNPCPWYAFDALSALQLLPRDGKSVAIDYKDREDSVFEEVARQIFDTVRRPEYQPPRLRVAIVIRPDKIDLRRLPETGKALFGRAKEIALLDEAWSSDQTNLVSLVAWGGVGKSTLINKWLERLKADDFRGARRVFGWSFYSQGTNERVTSADQFIETALEWFGDPDPKQGSAWAKGERLADLVRQEKTLLVLDGMEPLQDPHQGIKDPALGRLIEELARENQGLCVVTTREPLRERADFTDRTHELDLVQISPEAGAALLEIRGVQGDEAALQKASSDFGSHALAINLLANFLRDTPGHHISHASEIPDLDIAVDQGRHPRRVMEAFARRFGEGPAMELLRLLGLFDRPATGDCITALRSPPAIPGLTEHLTQISDADWLRLLYQLRDLGLVAPQSHHAPDEIDAHPLVREHFGERLKSENPAAWRAGHERLYEHLKATPDKQRPSLADMAPLLQAVHHGCEAGRHQEALNEVYWARITRRNEFYGTKKLGAFGADLAALAGLFDPPWDKPVATLTEVWQTFILGAAAYDLRALGRLREAVAPMRAGLERAAERENWKNAAIGASNLSELHLTLGDVALAVAMGEASVDHADRSGDAAWRMCSRITWADALHQAGEVVPAQALFEAAEALQAERQPQYPRLYSLQGYQYCDLLLAQGRAAEVRERAAETLRWAESAQGVSNLDVALIRLSLGRAALALGERDEAGAQLDQAVDSLRQAGTIHHIPRGLLARAAFFRETGDFQAARRDLEEAMRIATRSEMRLFQCDADLEYARLALAEGQPEKAHEHLAEAKRLVKETGYNRRKPDIAELEAALA